MQDVVNLVQLLKFQSTPSARRATDKDRRTLETIFISIHALREEGDRTGLCCRRPTSGYFNPRPPRGGRRKTFGTLKYMLDISIHALREEGDLR